MTSKILLLGVGNTATAVADFYAQAPDQGGNLNLKITGTTRSADKTLALAERGLETIHDDGTRDCLALIEAAADGACVLVSYPPDQNGTSDLRYGSLLQKAAKIVYISSTGVYDGISGAIDESTALLSERTADLSESVQRRLTSENFWRERGACILRAPGLYGPQSGLHLRLLSGSYRLPGDGSNYVSRIHLKDLAAIIAAAFRLAKPESLYLVGDLEPAKHIDVVAWLCKKLDLPLPPSMPLSAVPLTLRGNRRIDSSLVRKELAIELLYPTYKEGFSDCLNRMS